MYNIKELLRDRKNKPLFSNTAHKIQNKNLRISMDILSLCGLYTTTKTNENVNDKNARPRLVELLHAKYANAYSTNRGRAFLLSRFRSRYLGLCDRAIICQETILVDNLFV